MVEGTDYFSKQHIRFIILKIFDNINTQDFGVKEIDFYQSLESYFNLSTTIDFANSNLSIRSTLSTMRELTKTSLNILVDTLPSIYESIIANKCVLRRKVNTFDFYAGDMLIDKFINGLRTLLIDTIKVYPTILKIQETCLKTIILLGN
jgi:hypothetical protein